MAKFFHLEIKIIAEQFIYMIILDRTRTAAEYDKHKISGGETQSLAIESKTVAAIALDSGIDKLCTAILIEKCFEIRLLCKSQ